MTLTIKTKMIAGIAGLLLASATATATAAQQAGEFVFIQDGVVLVMTENGAVPADAELAAKVQPLYVPMIVENETFEAPLSAQPVLAQGQVTQPTLQAPVELVTQATPIYRPVERAPIQRKVNRLKLSDIWSIGGFR